MAFGILIVFFFLSTVSASQDMDSLFQEHTQQKFDTARREGELFERRRKEGEEIKDREREFRDFTDTVTKKDSEREKEEKDTIDFYNELEDIREFVVSLAPSDDETRPLRRFGIDFIRNYSFSLREEELSFGPVNPDYRLGVGDEVVISMWGEVTFKETYEVSRGGTISPRGIGSITVAGLSLRQLEEKLTRQFSRVYSGVNYGRPNARTHFDVSMGSLRKKQVFIIGDVQNPGVYNIPSLSGIWGALSYAGGVRDKGSLRAIYIRRDGEIVDTVDLYSYFLDTAAIQEKPLASLADYDIIEVAPVQNTIALSGAVHRPAIYELYDEENLADLIQYAGGFLPEAYRGSCTIYRTIPGEGRRVFTVPLDMIDTVQLHKSDSIHVGYLREYDNTIEISGPVQRPGKYSYYEGMHLSDLIDLAGGVEEYLFDHRIEILRTNKDFSKEVLATNIGELLSGNEAYDVELQEWDVVRFYSRWDVEYRDYIVVKGEVQRPGRYFLRDNMTVQDVILLAGGFSQKAYKDTIEVSRISERNHRGGNKSTPKKIPVDDDFFKNDGLVLEHLDYIFVRENSYLRDQEVITLSGEFIYPGKYAKLSQDETLLSLIDRSGGVRNSAYLEGARFIRRKDSIGVVSIDINSLLSDKNEREDIVLEDGDSLYIPTRPRTVQVEGAVFYPSAVKYEPGRSVRHYIDGAGGMTPQGDRRSIYIIRANGEVRRVRRRSGYVNPGSRIVVSKKDDTEGLSGVDIMRLTQSLLGIMTSAVSLALLVDKLD
ncbi:SLBB domain-containing protein [Chitinivibrio alkaliphilus]|uniref:Putative capsule polysaccharide export protein n=1 Tax=Chitinivibrio alkaliphilus ACht1 TaxID=1313304 RepID=U7D7L9_9BACT|nr:SLBB domain-containing protein [Chitinivibrio alkaliphilus]ERP31928.1 putative capsule polysaccharide export protein [Chitinivibrio alkaliphilus ACht1]